MRKSLIVILTTCSLFRIASQVLADDTTSEPGFIVAAMRVEPKRWDKEYNFALLERDARQAARQGARMLVTCEGFLDGFASHPKYTPGATRERIVAFAEPIDGPWIQRTAELARELNMYICLGFAERRGDEMFNSVAVISSGGEVVLHYSKTHTPTEPFITPGSGFPIAKTEFGTLGALICFDRGFPEVSRILTLKGARILLIPAYGNDGERNEALLRTRAWENSVWIVYVRQNQALVINPSGKIIARDKNEGDELVLARIELRGEQGTGDIFHRRATELYRELLEIQTPIRP